MIIYNGQKLVSGDANSLTNYHCTRAQYNTLTPDENTIYVVTETNNDITIYLNNKQINGTIDYPLIIGNVSNVSRKYLSNTVALKWTDPNDVIDDNGDVIISWTKTKVMRKLNSYPESPEDGTVVVQETTRNTYVNDYFYDTGLENGTTYYYTIFSQSHTGTWSTGVGFTITPNSGNIDSSPSNLILSAGDQSFTATWDAAKNYIAETDETFEYTLEGYKLVYDTDHIPTSISDGTVINVAVGITETTVSNLVNGTTYYVSIFAIYSNNGVSSAASGQIVPVSYQVMTVRIDETNSDPYTALTYMDDAIEMEVGSNDWDNWFGCYPVILATGGTEVGVLNKDDYTKFEDGADASSYLSDGEYDVMTAFPILGYKLNREGNYLYVSMTNNPNAESDGYVYYAHTKGTTKKDKFYLGAYKGYINNSKLYSWSGEKPSSKTALSTFRTYATARKTGYQIEGFYQRTFIQCMYILKYKNLNSQTALGKGFVDQSADGVTDFTGITGVTNTKGFNYGSIYGSNSTNHRVKLFGLEDFWGNINEWLDGCICSSNGAYFLTDPTNNNFNNTGTNYINVGTWGSSPSGAMTKIIGTSLGGFVGTNSSGGSSSTYYCDCCNFYGSYGLLAGGSYNNGSLTGIFYLYYESVTQTYSYLSARLCYL